MATTTLKQRSEKLKRLTTKMLHWTVCTIVSLEAIHSTSTLCANKVTGLKKKKYQTKRSRENNSAIKLRNSFGNFFFLCSTMYTSCPSNSYTLFCAIILVYIVFLRAFIQIIQFIHSKSLFTALHWNEGSVSNDFKCWKWANDSYHILWQLFRQNWTGEIRSDR